MLHQRQYKIQREYPHTYERILNMSHYYCYYYPILDLYIQRFYC